jgi:hypothetical protein
VVLKFTEIGGEMSGKKAQSQVVLVFVATSTLGVGVPSETAARTPAKGNWSWKVEQQQGKIDQFLHTREVFVIDGRSSRRNGYRLNSPRPRPPDEPHP